MSFLCDISIILQADHETKRLSCEKFTSDISTEGGRDNLLRFQNDQFWTFEYFLVFSLFTCVHLLSGEFVGIRDVEEKYVLIIVFL